MKNFYTFIYENNNTLEDFLNAVMYSEHGQAKKIGRVYLELNPETNNGEPCLHIGDIDSNGPGEGQWILGQICNWADRKGLVITLEAIPGGHRGSRKPDKAKLIKWYVDNGFEIDEEETKYLGEISMVRYPK